MDIIWLGQAGLLFHTAACSVLIDPYLSDSVARAEPQNHRRVPVDERFLDVRPNVIICTHNHLDHVDKDTLCRYLVPDRPPVCVLAPEGAWQVVRSFGGGHNYVLFNRHTQWSIKGMRFTAVRAEHSDPYAIGVILEAENRVYYVTGDTLYNKEIFPDLPAHIDAVFLPVNGAGNNMNMEDAARFAQQTGADKAVPLHWGLFDSLDPTAFPCENRVIPAIYQKVNL